jgi:hypothetical protein
VSEKPDNLDEQAIAVAVALFSHGDASELLGEVSPDAAWLTELQKRRVFDREQARPGSWIASRIDDPEMIRACAELRRLDDQSRRLIERAIEAPGAPLSAVRKKAWRLLLRPRVAARGPNLHAPWFAALGRLNAGEFDYEARQLVAKAVKPVLAITKPRRWPGRSEPPTDPVTVSDLVHVDYSSDGYPQVAEILTAWPQELEREVALFRTLNRTLTEALEEAVDAGFLDGWDRASSAVPSVAQHPQNAHRRGFYPITGVLGNLWTRIANKNADQARVLALGWADTPFLLLTRLHLHALAFREVFPAREAIDAVRSLDDRFFWAGGARVEIMWLLTSRWAEFGDEDRGALELRICRGLPRDVFRADAADDGEWASVNDGAVFSRLTRITEAGRVLSANSLATIASISQRHPQWVANPGDRDDFPMWFESGSGPHGHPEFLSGIADDRLVREATRLQAERYFAEGDLWSVFCRADLDRALRGLRASAEAGNWDAKAWESFLWAAHQKGEMQFHRELADALLQAPTFAVRLFLAAAVAWLQQRREMLSDPDQTGGPRYFRLWDKLADIAYSVAPNDDPEQSEQDLIDGSLSAPGGKLAWTLYDSLVASEPKQGCGFGQELGPRFEQLVEAPGKPGLLARVVLSQHIAYVDWVDPAWTAEKLVHASRGPTLTLRYFGQPGLAAISARRASSTPSSPHFCKSLRDQMFRRGRSLRVSWDIYYKRRYGTGRMAADTILHLPKQREHSR